MEVGILLGCPNVFYVNFSGCLIEDSAPLSFRKKLIKLVTPIWSNSLILLFDTSQFYSTDTVSWAGMGHKIAEACRVYVNY